VDEGRERVGIVDVFGTVKGDEGLARRARVGAMQDAR
jgi:hypothetical protein